MSVRSSASLDSFGRPNLYRSNVDAGLSYPTTTESIQFGGTKYVDCGSICNFDSTDSFSICMWQKANTGINQPMFVKIVGSYPSWVGYIFNISDNHKLALHLINNFVTNSARVASATSIDTSVWKFLTATYNGNYLASGIELYINGVVEVKTVLSDNLGAASIKAAGNPKIGYFTQTGENYTGRLCEVSIYNRVLTPTEITEIYNSGKPTNLMTTTTYSVCSYWWRCGTGDTYPTIIDQKAVQNGTMTGMSSGDIVTDAP